MFRSILQVFALVLTLGLTGCNTELPTTATTAEPSTSQSNSSSDILKMHFIDVGQADSTLIQTSQGQSILVDGGNNADGDLVVDYLKSQGVEKLDAVVATHPHEDHIGGLDTVLNSFPVSSVYLPNATATTKTFEDFIEAIKTSEAKRIQIKAGETLDIGGLEATFLAPNNTTYEETNNYSAVLKVIYQETTFLLTGDAEALVEREILKNGFDVRAMVLKVGHHGSASSTSDSFLQAVSPQYAVISVGRDNDYGHPHRETLAKLTSSGINVLRTDLLGTLIASSDGKTVTFNKNNPSASMSNALPVTIPSSSGVKIGNIDLSAEIVTIVNTSSSPVDLSGWKLVSEKGSQSFSFPSGTVIAPGSTLNVVSGRNAQPSDGVLFWSKDNIWNNDGDPGLLYDANETIVSQFQ